MFTYYEIEQDGNMYYVYRVTVDDVGKTKYLIGSSNDKDKAEEYVDVMSKQNE